MKKKIFNVLMAAVFFTAATSMFISCKDYEGDVDNEFRSSINYLNDALAYQASQLQAQLDSLRKLQQECRDSCKAKQLELQNTIDSLNKLQQECRDSCKINHDDLQKQIDQLKDVDIKDLEKQIAQFNTNDSIFTEDIKDIKETLDGYNTQITDNTTNITTLTDQYNTLDSTLSKTFADYKAGWVWLNQNKTDIENLVNNYSSIIETKITGLRDSVNDALAHANQAYVFAQKDSAAIDSIFTKILPNYYTKTEINTMRDSLNAKIEAAKAIAVRADSVAAKAYHLADSAIVLANAALDSARENRIAIGELELAMKDADKALKEEIDSVARQLDTLKIKVNNIEKELGIVKSNLAKMITSIIPQSIFNPIFGSLTTPLGVNTNVLCSYYGYSLNNVDFPTDVIGPDLMSFIGSSESFIIYNGETLVNDMNNGKAYIGTLYTTINPNTVDFTNETLKLVNSKDEEAGVILEPLKKSDKELTFGYTRANNGFYECDVYAPVNNIQDLRITKNLDLEKLKSIAKDVLNSLKKRAITNFNVTDIYKTVLNNMQDIMPAYGLKATWTEDSTKIEHSIYSKYEIAATCVKPVSYEFLKNADLPTIPLVDHISYDVDFHLDYPTFNPITSPDLQLSVYIVYQEIATIKTVIGVYSNKSQAEATVAANPGSWYEAQTFTIAGLQSFVDQINHEIIFKLVEDIKNLEDQIIRQTQKNVNKVLKDVNTKVVDRVNKIIKKINPRIQNANYYLQPTMIMEGGDGNWYKVSQRTFLPTTVRGKGATLLEPTSLTAETLCPAFKKFVAVTNVWKTSNPAINAQAGDADCKARLDYANKGYRMKTIYDDRFDVIFQSDAVGYTYEITYACIDYSGISRTTKYYIKTVE